MAGGGNIIVPGEGGNNWSYGQWAMNLLINGAGQDQLHDGSGEDLLIGGTEDANSTALHSAAG